MNREKQKKTPLLTAMKKYMESGPVPFDVPGHKMGRVQNDLTDLIGVDAFRADVNAPIGIDNLYKGTGVIAEAEKLFADAFGADYAIFLINGTTSGIMMMVMATLSAGDSIILPRNVHKSMINSLIVSGAVPIFVEPEYDLELGIANGVCVESYIEAMDLHPEAKAIFVINPTYFGIASDLSTIVEEAHSRNMIVLVDEAHGAHFAFHDQLPKSAMACGADMTSMSIHKTLGSLTQSSALLIQGDRVNYQKVRRAYTMFGSTSPSHLLLASLDAARKKIALEGKKILEENLKLAKYARKKLNHIPGVSVLDQGYCDEKDSSRFAFDETRLVIRVDSLGKSGFEVMKDFRRFYNIQFELAETYLVLAILAIGSTRKDVDRLCAAFQDYSQRVYQKGVKHRIRNLVFDYADLEITPREAYFSPNEMIAIEEAEGRISSESVMIYPPGIPILIPGEKITKSILKTYAFYIRKKGTIMSDSPIGLIRVVKEEKI